MTGQDNRRHQQDVSQFDSGWVGAEQDEDLDQRLDAEGGSFDEAQPHVLTALGPIEPEALGVTLFAGGRLPVTSGGLNPGEALLELEQAYAAGVRAVTDVTRDRLIRDSADVLWVSARSPVHLIVRDVTPPSQGGTRPAGVRAGFTMRESMSPDDWERAANGLPVFVRVTSLQEISGTLTHAQSKPWERAPFIVIDEVAFGPGRGWLDSLETVAGVVLIVATDDRSRMTRAAGRCRELLDRAHGDRLALGYNADPVLLMERFPLLLMEAGVPADAVRRILTENAARMLTRAGSG